MKYSQSLVSLLAVAVFGIALPWFKGLSFFNPILLLAYACLGALFIVPAAIGLGALRPPAPSLLARMALLLGYGWLLSVTILASGLVTVNLLHWRGQVIAPSTSFLASALLLGLATCFALIAGGTALGMSCGATSARNVLRTGLLLLVLVLAFLMNRGFTTRGLSSFAFGMSAVLMLIGAAVTTWALGRARVRVQ